MKAQVLFGIGNIKYTEVEKPVPKEGEALVRITRCGICGSDIPRVFKTGAHNMPLIPGHEMAGVVESCDSRPNLEGKRVGIFPLIPCKVCSQCESRRYEMCENYNYLGSRCDGGFAEYAAVPVWNLLPIPDLVSDDEAAMLEPMSVAVHAMREIGLLNIQSQCAGESDDLQKQSRGNDELNGHQSECNVPKNSSIVVCGLGTIGLLIALFLKDAGFQNVFCIGNKDVQKEKLMAMGYGTDRFCDIRYADSKAYIKDKTDGKGADYYFECIGRSESYAQAVECTAPLGHVMLVGNPASDMELKRETYWKILRKQMLLKGTWNSSFYGIDENADDWRYALGRVAYWNKERTSGEALMLPSDLITHRFSLEELIKGLDIMKNKSQEYVKVMISM